MEAIRSGHASKEQELSAEVFPGALAPISFTPRVSNESVDAAIIPPITTKSATGLCLKKIFAKNEQRERNSSDEKGHRVGFIQVFEEEACVSPKASMSAVEIRKASVVVCWQGKVQRRI